MKQFFFTYILSLSFHILLLSLFLIRSHEPTRHASCPLFWLVGNGTHVRPPRWKHMLPIHQMADLSRYEMRVLICRIANVCPLACSLVRAVGSKHQLEPHSSSRHSFYQVRLGMETNSHFGLRLRLRIDRVGLCLWLQKLFLFFRCQIPR